MTKFCVFLLIINFIVFFINRSDCVILRTKQGVLDGKVLSSRGGRPFYAFYGIPYAEPPVGKLRFENPVPAKSWDGVKDATTFPPICLHIHRETLTGQEDCLYLNVYTPYIKNDTLLPVMVYTYGGRYMYDELAQPRNLGPHYFMDKDVILILYQYRIGVFGFLSTEDEVIPGNFGLKDQVAVLQWIQNYIEDFGGDKNRVTLFGGSSGATSASLCLVSPLAKGLFHRVISQSGHPLDLEKPGNARLYAQKYASLVGCDDDNMKTSLDLLNCLRNVPADKLASHNENLFTVGFLLPNLPWGPVVENEKIPGAFLVDEPRKLLQRKSDIPWMMGINSDDGGMMALITYDPKLSQMLDELEKNYKTHFPALFRYGRDVDNTELLDNMTETYKRHYFGEKNISQSVRGFSDMFTSLIYLVGIAESTKLYKGPKYVYYYDHLNKDSFSKIFPKSEEKIGVIHGDELISMFNWTSIIEPITEGKDLIVSEQIINLWTNFAVKGDPNDDNYEISWDPVKSPSINYLHIKDGALEVKNEFLKSEIDFLYSFPVNGYF